MAGLLLLGYTGGSGAQPVLATGPDAEVTEDNLHRVDPSVMDAAWVRPDLDLSRYTKILFRPTGVSFREVADRTYSIRGSENVTEFPVSDEMKTRLRALFHETFYEDLSEVDAYEMYVGVGRDVLMVQGFLVDVVSGIPPDTSATTVRSINWPWEASIVIELRDSMSNDILARTIERQRAGGPIDAGAVLEQTRRLVRSWSFRLCRRLEELSELSGT